MQGRIFSTRKDFRAFSESGTPFNGNLIPVIN